MIGKSKIVVLFSCLVISMILFNISRISNNVTSEASVKTSGASVKTSKASVRISGTSVKTSGASVKTSGASVKTSKASVRISGTSVETSGASVKTSGTSVKTSGASVKHQWSTRRASSPVKYAVIAASTPINPKNPKAYNYMFDLPLTALAWLRIGFKSIVMIPGSKAAWLKAPPLRLVYDSLSKLNAKLIFFEGKADNLIMLSQTSRLFASCVDGVRPEDYLLTSDSDLWPVNKQKYLLSPGKDLLSTNAYCCGIFRHKSEQYRMLPMASIGTMSATWNDIMFPNSSNTCTNLTSSYILDYFSKEMGPMVFHKVSKNMNDGWYMDQHMISIRVQQWINRRNVTKSRLEYVSRVGGDRLDRAYWKNEGQNIKALTDSHLLNHLYEEGAWMKALPLMEGMYGKESQEYKSCQTYREDFMKLFQKAYNKTI